MEKDILKMEQDIKFAEKTMWDYAKCAEGNRNDSKIFYN